MQEEINKQQKQLQQQNAAKKDERQPAPIADELKHHMGEQQFHLDMSAMPPPPGQRNLAYPANLRPFPYHMAPQDRFAMDGPLHPMYAVNGQGRNMPVVAAHFGAPSTATDLSKQIAGQSPATDPLKRSPGIKPVQDAAYLSQMHRQQLPSPGAHSPAYRKDLPTVQEPTAIDMMRSQMVAAGQFHPKDLAVASAQGPLPLNMSSHVNQRPPSRPPSAIVQTPPAPQSRPSSESSVVEQPTSLVRRQPPPVPAGHPSNSALGSEPPLNAPPTAQAIPNPIPSHLGPGHNTPQPASTAPDPQIIVQKYPILWNGILALKNDQVLVQMHFVSGNKDITARALPLFSDVDMQPLRITQRMRIDQSQLQALTRKIQCADEYCILLALPCGRDNSDVLIQSNNLKRYFINYLTSKLAAGIVNTNDETCSYITHIFPNCDFSDEHLVRFAPDLLHALQGISHLMVVITSNLPNNAVY